MTKLDEVVLSTAVALSPRSCRAERKEQWLADTRDAEELGMSRWGVVLGALSTSLVSRGAHPRPAGASAETKDLKMNYMHRSRGTIAKLAAGTLTASALLAGGIVAGANWVGTEIQTASRQMSFASSQGPVTWMDPDHQPAPEWTDVSTLTIVGTIDPATGEETDIPPTHPATIPQ